MQKKIYSEYVCTIIIIIQEEDYQRNQYNKSIVRAYVLSC